MSKQVPLNPSEQKKNLFGRHKILFTVIGIAVLYVPVKEAYRRAIKE